MNIRRDANVVMNFDISNTLPPPQLFNYQVLSLAYKMVATYILGLLHFFHLALYL